MWKACRVAAAAEAAPVAEVNAQASTQNAPVAASLPTLLPGGATLNYMFDGYYEYDFNHPIGRIQYLRAYDVLSNAFSINQADIVFDLDPNVAEGRRYGMRVDLQFGQATDTLQGNPSNEVRPQIYRNIFQAYGTYVAPLGKGLTVDFGKWASSLGIEGNYTKDQVNYSRSFFFDYLPFYHMGVRASYKVNDKLALNYWLVNGTDQTEPTNSYKDELFGFTAQPTKNISWTANYYVGQDHPDVSQATNCTVPLQPGLCVQPINPAPDGKAHIFDSYVTWNATPKLTFSAEGDYVISREWANAAPGESSAPSLVDGGAAYARYQFESADGAWRAIRVFQRPERSVQRNVAGAEGVYRDLRLQVWRGVPGEGRVQEGLEQCSVLPDEQAGGAIGEPAYVYGRDGVVVRREARGVVADSLRMIEGPAASCI